MQYNTIQYSTTQHGTIQCHTDLYNTIRDNTTPHNKVIVLCNTVRYSHIQSYTIQYHTVLYNPMPYSLIQYNAIQYAITTTSSNTWTSDDNNTYQKSVRDFGTSPLLKWNRWLWMMLGNQGKIDGHLLECPGRSASGPVPRPSQRSPSLCRRPFKRRTGSGQVKPQKPGQSSHFRLFISTWWQDRIRFTKLN